MRELIDKLLFRVLVAFVVIVVCFMYLNPIDACLDQGGRWDWDRLGCEGARGKWVW